MISRFCGRKSENDSFLSGTGVLGLDKLGNLNDLFFLSGLLGAGLAVSGFRDLQESLLMSNRPVTTPGSLLVDFLLLVELDAVEGRLGDAGAAFWRTGGGNGAVASDGDVGGTYRMRP